MKGRKRLNGNTKALSEFYDIYGDGIARLNLKKAIFHKKFRGRIGRAESTTGDFDVNDPRVSAVSAKCGGEQ